MSLHHNGRLVTYDAATGTAIFKSRFSSGGTFTASPVAANGKIYMATEEGLVYVLESGPEYAELAVNEMREPLMATPAISEGAALPTHANPTRRGRQRARGVGSNVSGSWFHRPLESPRIYNAVQTLLGAGGNSLDTVYARGFGSSSGSVLDVGCGPDPGDTPPGRTPDRTRHQFALRRTLRRSARHTSVRVPRSGRLRSGDALYRRFVHRVSQRGR